MLYLFDLDGTLISGYLDNPDKDFNRWSVLPNRREKIARLRLRGNVCCVVTNQGGVAFGFVSEDAARAKIATAMVLTRFYFGDAADVEGKPLVYVCFHDTRAKPPYNILSRPPAASPAAR